MIHRTRLIVTAIAFTAVAASGLTGGPLTATAADDSSSAVKDTDGDGQLDSATTSAAVVGAEEAGKPVEDRSQRGETATTVANSDGTFTVRDYAAAIRVKDEHGDWADVDYTLEKKPDGTYGPKAAPGDVSIGGGGSGDAASVTFADGTGVALTWPEDLPEPTISKGTATYKVSDSADLLVSVTGSGLATRIRLNEEPSADDPALTLGLETTNLNIDQPSDDKLEFEKTSGKRLGTVSSMAAWDSRRDEFGDPVEVVPVEASLEKTDTAGSTVTHEMELDVPGGFLEDADTQYPVMIDPDISAVSLTQDTWVRSGTSTVDTLPYRLLVGRIASHSSSMPAHSYIQWSNTELADRNITAATMNLYQYAAGSCSAKSMNIHPLENTWSENTTTWYANKPNGMTDTGTSTSLTEMRGGDGCAANGYVSTSIAGMAQAWANGSANGGFANRGVQLNVPSANGTDVQYERRFCSSEPDTTTSSCTTATRTPYLSITYNSYPGTASTPVVTMNGSEVTFTSHATDPDGGMVRIQFEVSQAGIMLSGGYSELVASGASASRTLPSLENGSYTVRAWADDGQLASKQATPSIDFAVNSTDADLPETPDPNEATSGDSQDWSELEGMDLPSPESEDSWGQTETSEGEATAIADSTDADVPLPDAVADSIVQPELESQMTTAQASQVVESPHKCEGYSTNPHIALTGAYRGDTKGYAGTDCKYGTQTDLILKVYIQRKRWFGWETKGSMRGGTKVFDKYFIHRSAVWEGCNNNRRDWRTRASHYEIYAGTTYSTFTQNYNRVKECL